MPKSAKPQSERNPKEETGTKTQRSEQKVPEWAENMEHTLRRLVREKERQRSKNPGLYR